MKNEFTALDIFKALKIPRERLRAWTKLGFITPTVPAAGQGIKAVFTIQDVYGVALFRSLIDAGFGRAGAGDWVNQFLKRTKGEPDHQKTKYILFKTRKEKDKTVASVITLADGQWLLDLKSGGICPGWFPSAVNEGITQLTSKGEGWDSFYIVNFKTLQEDVEKALLKL